jgi:hypothetical protein
MRNRPDFSAPKKFAEMMGSLLPFRGATTIIAVQHKSSGQASFGPH